jgi:hypothetical protein
VARRRCDLFAARKTQYERSGVLVNERSKDALALCLSRDEIATNHMVAALHSFDCLRLAVRHLNSGASHEAVSKANGRSATHDGSSCRKAKAECARTEFADH